MLGKFFLLKSSDPQRRRSLRQLVLGVAVVALAMGAGPVACFSDVVLPDCEKRDVPCTNSAKAGDAGAPQVSARNLGGGGGGGDAANSSAGAGTGGAGAGTGGTGGTGGAGGAGAGTGGTSGAGTGGTSGAGGAIPCPTCLIEPTALPAPCATSPSYATSLTVSGSAGPFEWRITPPVDQWSVGADSTSADGARVTLKGPSASVTSVSVEVTVGTGAVVRRTYAVQPRSTCWFAYTTLGTAGPVLKLIDPLLPSSATAPWPILSHDQAVYDFQFSPDGRYLSYRFGADTNNPKGKHLALVTLSPFTDQALDFGEDSVTAYAWSKDSKTLAVAFKRASVGYLGGIVLAPSGAPAQQTVLPATPAFVDSELSWVGASELAFYAAVVLGADPNTLLPNPYAQQTPFFAVLGPAGFFAPVPSPDMLTYNAGAFLQPTEAGFFMVASDPYTTFYPGPTAYGLPHFSISALAPSGNFSAVLSGDQLQLFAASDGTLGDPSYTSADNASCPKLLAWAKARERLACVANVTDQPPGTTHGEVRIYDALAASMTLSMLPLQGYCSKNSVAPETSRCADLEYDYTEENSAVQARGFSPSGRFFAFTTSAASASAGSTLYWADVSTPGSIGLKRKVPLSVSGTVATAPSALAFSRDDHYILLQSGNVLVAHDLTVPQNSGSASLPVLVTQGLLPQATDPCSEDFQSAPHRWCGSADRDLTFAWAPDPRYAAYRSKAGLTVVDFTEFSTPTFNPHDAIDCDGQCSSQFAFQPQP